MKSISISGSCQNQKLLVTRLRCSPASGLLPLSVLRLERTTDSGMDLEPKGSLEV